MALVLILGFASTIRYALYTQIVRAEGHVQICPGLIPAVPGGTDDALRVAAPEGPVVAEIAELGALAATDIAAATAAQGAHAGQPAIDLMVAGAEGAPNATTVWVRGASEQARRQAARYWSVDFWIEADTNRPVKGRFYAASGKLMKIAFYFDFRPALGAERPMKVSIVDGLDTARITVMAFSGYQGAELPDAWLQPAYLPKFRM